MKRKIWIFLVLVFSAYILFSCGISMPRASEEEESSSTSSQSVVEGDREVDLKLKNDLKLKLKSPFKAGGSYFVVVAVDTKGNKYEATNDNGTYRLYLLTNNTYFIYVMEVDGSTTNIMPINFGDERIALFLNPDNTNGTPPLDLGEISNNSGNNPTKIVTFVVPSNFIAHTGYNYSEGFDDDGDGVFDFAGAIDRNTNGIPDILEGNTNNLGASEISNGFETLTDPYIIAFLAADPNLDFFNKLPEKTNAITNFVLSTNLKPFWGYYPNNYTNLTVKVALDASFTSMLGGSEGWTNLLAVVLANPNFTNKIPAEYIDEFGSLANNTTLGNELTSRLTNIYIPAFDAVTNKLISAIGQIPPPSFINGDVSGNVVISYTPTNAIFNFNSYKDSGFYINGNITYTYATDQVTGSLTVYDDFIYGEISYDGTLVTVKLGNWQITY
ncbi:MAG: hypothetical protein ACP5QT_00320 [Brevinematia bacterium]